MASNYNSDGYDELQECPYNKSHQILKFRMQTHLVKCKKSYPNAKKRICSFNSTHHVNEQEYEYHMKNCEDRGSFEKFKNPINTSQPNASIPVQTGRHIVEGEENWDNINIPSYDPKKYVESAPVLRNVNGLTPSQRKAFRTAEIARLGALNK